MMNRMLVFAGMLTVAALASGCIPGGDPEGPGAAGKISLGAGVDASAFKTLAVRAVPDTGDPFDPSHPQFTAPAPDGEPAWSADVESLDGMTFPHPYGVGDELGTTSQQHWRLFAWLSASDGSGDGPKSGEPFGTATFDVDGCGLAYGGYCTTKAGIDVSIDLKAP